MYAYALPTPTFTAAWGHYSRLSSPIGGGIARGNRGDGSSSTFHAGVSRARGPRRMRDRNLHFHPPSDPHRRGLIIPDRYSLIYENGGEGGWDSGIACPLRPSLPLFVGDVYRDSCASGVGLSLLLFAFVERAVLAWGRMAPMGVFGWLRWTIVTIFGRFLFQFRWFSFFFFKGVFILHILIILNGYNIGFLNEYLITWYKERVSYILLFSLI